MGLRIIPTLCSEEKKIIFGWRENQRLNVTFCIKRDPFVYIPAKISQKKLDLSYKKEQRPANAILAGEQNLLQAVSLSMLSQYALILLFTSAH